MFLGATSLPARRATRRVQRGRWGQPVVFGGSNVHQGAVPAAIQLGQGASPVSGSLQVTQLVHQSESQCLVSSPDSTSSDFLHLLDGQAPAVGDVGP